jgi:hypothetical protein
VGSLTRGRLRAGPLTSKIIKPHWQQLRIAYGLLDATVAEVSLQRPYGVLLVHQRMLARVPEHVRLALKAQLSLALLHAGRTADDLTYLSATQTPIPMTLGNMHANGVRSLSVWYLGCACKVHEIVTAVVGHVAFPFNFRKITVIL